MTDQPSKPFVAGYLTGPSYPVDIGQRQLKEALGAKGLLPTTVGLRQVSRSVSPVQQRTTLIVRHEQVQTVEETYRFVGSRRPTDRQPDNDPVQAQQDWIVSNEGTAQATEKETVAPERIDGGIMPAVEIVVFMIVGAFVALLISPYSPFRATAPLLMMIVLPASAAVAVLYAIYHERRRRVGV